MHDLVVALFELAINVDVLDVKAGEVLKNFVVGPRLDVLKPLLDCIQIKNSARHRKEKEFQLITNMDKHQSGPPGTYLGSEPVEEIVHDPFTLDMEIVSAIRLI